MYLELVTPDKKVFAGEVTGVKVPGIDGSFEMLNNHAPIISALDKGDIRIRTAEGDTVVTIDSGIVELSNNKIIILAESVLN